ncbi:hypothetical protein [Demequina pelophila]|uniref:hypothetical protein n=1 Tax=Demequina pelophila TaxID=1638984 RepID=UPI0007863B5F|nr:hypothetical protein [Demequina pelophila]
MAEPTYPDVPVKTERPATWKLVSATLATVALTSTVAQMLAVASLGYTPEFALSTGGLVALIAAFVVHRGCRDWSDFKRRIMPWAIGTAALAFGTVYLMAHNMGLL